MEIYHQTKHMEGKIHHLNLVSKLAKKKILSSLSKMNDQFF